MEDYTEIDKVYVFDKSENLIAVFDKDDDEPIINPQVQKTQNAESVFTFSISPNNPKWLEINNPENIYKVDGKAYSTNFEGCFTEVINENNEDFIEVKGYERQKLLSRKFVRAWNSETGFEKIDTFMVVILSNGDLPLKNNGTVVNTTYQKGTSGYVLEGLLYGTGWTVGTCDVEGIFDFESDQVDIYENILKVQQIWGGILVFDSINKVVHHRDETTWLPYNGYEVKYQKNMQSLEKLYNNKIITKLCPLGEGGLNIKSVNNGSEWLTNFEYTDSILEGIENNPDINDPEQLLRWGIRKLQGLSKPRKELTVKAVLLYQVEGYELERVDLNDIVDVINYANVDNDIEQLRVVGFTYKIWDFSDATIELSDVTLESTDIFKKNVQATNSINAGTLNAKKVVNSKNGESIDSQIQDLQDSSISNVDVEYALGTSTETPPLTGWSTSAPTWEQGKYMWQRTKVTYADGTERLSAITCIAGAKGDTGSGGVGISSITEYYAVSSSNSTAPADSNFVTSPIPTMTSINKYLWNYELIRYTNNTTETTAKRVIGTYGDKGDKGDTGDTGATGKGISSILNYYQVSTSNTTAPTTWIPETSTMPQLTSTNKYLWNYENITYTDNTHYTSTATVIGTYGDEGIGYVSAKELYYLHTSNSSAPAAPTVHVTDETGNAGVWTRKCPIWASGKYYWVCTEFLYTDGHYGWSTPVSQGGLNTANSTANDANNKIDNLYIGGRNYILNSKGDTKAGFFKNFSKVEDGYGEHTLTSKKTFVQLNLSPGYLIKPKQYEAGQEIVFSFDIMYTVWNFPAGTNRQEFWIGQRYGSPSWASMTQFTLPSVGSNGCELNKWYHATYKHTIRNPNPPSNQTDVDSIQEAIQFYNSSDIEASVTFRIKNVKLEFGNKETDWTPAPEDLTTNKELDVILQEKTDDIVATVTSNTTGNIMTLLNNGYLTAEQVGALVKGNSDDIVTIKKQIEQTITDDEMRIAISTAIAGGVSYLKNTLFTINDEGLWIATSQDEFNAQYNNKGMYLYTFDQMIAKFDVDGSTINGKLKLNGEFETPNLRMMNVTINNVAHTHVHWIGG